MKSYSSRQAAQRLGISFPTLNRYLGANKIPAPAVTELGTARVRLWTDEDIERVREILPKIANGRKMRYKKQSAPTARRGRLSSQHSAKPKSKTGSKSKKKKR